MTEIKSILLTGCSGVIGRKVFEVLSDHYTILNVGRSKDTNFKFDLSNNQIDLTGEINRPDFVVHMAACVPGANGILDNEISANLTKTIDNSILKACEIWGCPVIYFSGCSLYETKGERSITETDPFKDFFSSPYLRAKAIGDLKFRSLSKGIVLRISLPVGSGLSNATALGKFIKQLDIQKEINIFGNGTRERDFIDVRDIASAIFSLTKKTKFGVFNIASGNPVSMKKLAELIITLKGSGKFILGQQSDAYDGEFSRYSIQKSFEELGWKPRFSIKDMLIDHGL